MPTESVRRVWAGAGPQHAAYRRGGISCGLAYSLLSLLVFNVKHRKLDFVISVHCVMLLCPRPHRGIIALMAAVCPSVCPMHDPKSNMVGRSKLKISRKEARHG